MAATIVTAPFVLPGILCNANGTALSDGTTVITTGATAPLVKPAVLVNAAGTPI